MPSATGVGTATFLGAGHEPTSDAGLAPPDAVTVPSRSTPSPDMPYSSPAAMAPRVSSTTTAEPTLDRQRIGGDYRRSIEPALGAGPRRVPASEGADLL